MTEKYSVLDEVINPGLTIGDTVSGVDEMFRFVHGTIYGILQWVGPLYTDMLSLIASIPSILHSLYIHCVCVVEGIVWWKRVFGSWIQLLTSEGTLDSMNSVESLRRKLKVGQGSQQRRQRSRTTQRRKKKGATS